VTLAAGYRPAARSWTISARSAALFSLVTLVIGSSDRISTRSGYSSAYFLNFFNPYSWRCR
jgi:hypothetical protein